MDPFIGQIMPWPAPYAPRGWALCDGSVLQISQNAALYAVIGNYYGGDGVTTFALPDLRGRTVVGAPQINQVGQKGGNAAAPVTVTGSATINIGIDNLPPHNHAATFTPGAGANVSVAIPADNTGASDNTPAPGMVMGKGVVGVNPVKVFSGNAGNTTLKPFDVAVPAATGTVSTNNSGNGNSLSVPLSLSGNVPIQPPFVTLNYIIALDGNFPVRE